MLSLPGVDRKTYPERFGRGLPLPQVGCPDPACSGQLRGHGWYRRFVDGILAAIRRLRCNRCGVTHAVLPEDICAYRDATLPALEAAMEAGVGPSAGAKAAGQRGAAGVRRVRRWMRSLEGRRVAQVVALLPAVAGSFLERVRAMVGPAPGALIRLRHWLWSTYTYFLGGLTGLFRHGRPSLAIRGAST